ncbi:hypothetical protein GK505_13555 [Salmonella enterica subsp. enterica]|nr:hypothetical protein [Salmonella enterica subsp. enterica]EEB0499229.1 hypothetical protein [Salmonella enterica subsp. enterica serovar Javiana]
MTTNNHPAHGPVSLDRLHHIREHLQHDTQYSNGGNRAYLLADMLKVVDEVLASRNAEPVLPDEKPMPEASKMHAIDAVAAIAEVRGWNACRAAMLQAGNSPATPDGLVGRGENCWSCGKYFTYEQHSECDGYCPHCDSPVDLDDEEDEQSKSLPANPTEEMISNAWREVLGKCDHETIRRMYVAMFAAAPQQEV